MHRGAAREPADLNICRRPQNCSRCKLASFSSLRALLPAYQIVNGKLKPRRNSADDRRASLLCLFSPCRNKVRSQPTKSRRFAGWISISVLEEREKGEVNKLLHSGYIGHAIPHNRIQSKGLVTYLSRTPISNLSRTTIPKQLLQAIRVQSTPVCGDTIQSGGRTIFRTPHPAALLCVDRSVASSANGQKCGGRDRDSPKPLEVENVTAQNPYRSGRDRESRKKRTRP